jgi:hypothetical protein
MVALEEPVVWMEHVNCLGIKTNYMNDTFIMYTIICKPMSVCVDYGYQLLHYKSIVNKICFTKSSKDISPVEYLKQSPNFF